MTTKEESPFKKNKSEIIWNIVNSGLAGLLVLLGAFISGSITMTGILVAITTALIVFVTKFKDYWLGQESEYKSLKIFEFV